MKHKRFLSILLALVMVFTLLPVLTPPAKAAGDVPINSTYFPDDNFRGYISEFLDENNNNKLDEDEITGVVRLYLDNEGIKDLTGVEYFTALTYLDVENNSLTELDLTSNTALEHVFCRNNNLKKLNVEGLSGQTASSRRGRLR